MSIVSELELLEAQDHLDSDQLTRLSDLKEIFRSEESKPEGLVSTGDPVADYWEWQISQGLPIDFSLTEPPPVKDWICRKP